MSAPTGEPCLTCNRKEYPMTIEEHAITYLQLETMGQRLRNMAAALADLETPAAFDDMALELSAIITALFSAERALLEATGVA
jgi:hypothetical protein